MLLPCSTNTVQYSAGSSSVVTRPCRSVVSHHSGSSHRGQGTETWPTPPSYTIAIPGPMHGQHIAQEGGTPMVSTLRIATFNCENLFSRPKIFRESKARSTELLGYVAELQAELRNDVFHHPRIKELKAKLHGYVTMVDIRGSHTSAAGAKEWL